MIRRNSILRYFRRLLPGLVLLALSGWLTNCTVQQKVLTINKIAVYESLGGVGNNAGRQLREAGVGRIYLVNGHFVHDKSKLKFAPDKLSAWVDKYLPDPQSAVTVVLDWEGPRMDQIFAGPQVQGEYEEAKRELLSAYALVKKMRPNTKVGFYGFPERNYWNRDEAWRSRNTAMADFLGQVDAIFPSIYDFYRTNDRNRGEELGYVRENTEEALRLGTALNKPVFPFIWHRYHDSNKKFRRQLIPEAEFREHVGTIARSTYEGSKVDGIVWWSSEQYFYNIAKKNASGPKGPIDEVVGQPTLLYFESLQRALRE